MRRCLLALAAISACTSQPPVPAAARIGAEVALPGEPFFHDSTGGRLVLGAGYEVHSRVAGRGGLEPEARAEQTPRGIELSWHFATRVSSPLRVVSNVSPRGRAREVTGGVCIGAVCVRDAAWVDARGRKTPLDIVASADGFEIEVPDDVLESSEFPAVLDPIVTLERETPPRAFEWRLDSDEIFSASLGTDHLVMWTGASSAFARVNGAGTVLDLPAKPSWVAAPGQLVRGVFAVGSDFAVFASDATGLRLFRAQPDGQPASPASNGTLLGPCSALATVDAAVSGNVMAIAWEHGNDVRLALVDLTTGAAQPSVVLGTGGSPKLAADATGFVALWTRYVNFRPVAVVRRFSTSGVLQPESTPLNRAQAHFALVNAGAAVWVVWAETMVTNGALSLFAQPLASFGQATPAPLSLGTQTDANSYGVLAAWSGQRIIAVQVETKTNALGHVFRVFAIDPVAMTASGPTEVTTAGIIQRTWSLNCATSDCLLVWSKLTGGTRISPTGQVLDTPELAIGREHGRSAVVSVTATDRDFFVVTSDKHRGLQDRGVFVDRDGGIVSGSLPVGPEWYLQTPGPGPSAVAASGDALYAMWSDGVQQSFVAPISRDAGVTTSMPAGSNFNQYRLAGGAFGWVVLLTESQSQRVFGHVVDRAGDRMANLWMPPPTFTFSPPVVAARDDEFIVGWRGGLSSSRLAFLGTDGGLVGPGIVGPTPGIAKAAVFGADRYLVTTESNSFFFVYLDGGFSPVGYLSGDPHSASFDGTQFLVTMNYASRPLTRIQLDGGVHVSSLLSVSGGLSCVAASRDGRTLIAYVRLVGQVERTFTRLIDWRANALGGACDFDSDCASGNCIDNRCCDTRCGESNPSDCQACSVAAGAAVDGVCAPRASGTVCRASDGVCDVAEVCDGTSGSCPADTFVDAGVRCRPSIGACTLEASCSGTLPFCPDPPVADGTPCDDGWECSLGDRCVGGVCEFLATADAGTPCLDGDPCSATSVCDGWVNCVLATAVQCTAPFPDCQVPYCSQGVGCAWFPKPSSTLCDDGDACTISDHCSNGACVGTSTVTCPDQPCLVSGTCSPSTGLCSYVPRADGTSCDDRDVCTIDDVCTAGRCGGAPKPCSPASACRQAGVCDATTGACVDAPLPDGTPCNDGNACTVEDACRSGACAGAAKTCPPAAVCHGAASCNPSTGACEAAAQPDGTACDDGLSCTLDDRCAAGACAGRVPQCPDPGPCQRVTRCGDDGGCAWAPVDDGTPCSGGTCRAGACEVPLPRGCGCDASGAGSALLALAVLLRRRRAR